MLSIEQTNTPGPLKLGNNLKKDIGMYALALLEKTYNVFIEVCYEVLCYQYKNIFDYLGVAKLFLPIKSSIRLTCYEWKVFLLFLLVIILHICISNYSIILFIDCSLESIFNATEIKFALEKQN